MSKYLLIEYKTVGHVAPGHDIDCYFVNGLEALAEAITKAKGLGLLISESEILSQFSDLKLLSNQNGCLVITKVN